MVNSDAGTMISSEDSLRCSMGRLDHSYANDLDRRHSMQFDIDYRHRVADSSIQSSFVLSRPTCASNLLRNW